MTHPDQAIEGVDSFARAILNGERGKLPNGVTFSAVWKSGDSVEVALYSGVSRVALLVGNVDSKGPAGCGRTRADVAQTMARTLLPMAEKAAGQTIEQEIQAKGLTAARHYQGHAVNLTELGEKAARIRSEMDLLSSMLANVRKDAGDVTAIIGQVVRLKSNTGMQMTAAALDDDGGILCAWMDGAQYMEASIPLAALELVNQQNATVKTPVARKRAAK